MTSWARCRARNSTHNSCQGHGQGSPSYDIAAYKKEAKRKGPLGDFAAATVPTLEKHLKTAESLAQMKQSHR